MKFTSLGLKKPDGTDPVDVQDFNDNADLIDSRLQECATKEGDAGSMTVAFGEAPQLTELTSNDSLTGLFGRLKTAVKKVIVHEKTLTGLTQNISEIRVVSGLPADAAKNKTTLYIIEG